MTILKEHKGKNCMVHNCNELGEFYNPDSNMKYCLSCKEKLKGKIIYQMASTINGISQKEISQKLLKIDFPIIEFDIMNVGV